MIQLNMVYSGRSIYGIKSSPFHISEQVHAVLEDGYLDPFQSVFRPGFGMEIAVVTLIDDVYWTSDGRVVLC